MTTLRSLLKQPRFTVVASLTLALGVGAVTVIFSVVNGVLLKPLPYPDADRVVNVWSHAPKIGYDQFPLSPDVFFAYERDNQVFESMALFQRRRANLTGQDTPEVVESIVATNTYFRTLGLPVVQGRDFSDKEDAPDGPHVVVISSRAWTNRFAGGKSAIGKTIRLDGRPTEIIGIASPALDSTGSPDFFLPSGMNRTNPIQGNFGWNAIARLKPGVRAEDASSHLIPIVQKLLAALNSPTYRAFLIDGDYKPQVVLAKEDLVGDLKRPLWILLGTVGMLLLVACANVANLFLVRAEGKQREIGIRAALGAGRMNLVRHVMAEALLLSTIGSGLGVLIAALGLPALIKAAPPSIPRLDQVVLDWRVLLFAAGVAIVSAFIFGLAPALRYTRQRSLATIGHTSRGGTEEPGRRRIRQVLVVAQTALALILLVGSGLLARSFARLTSTSLGFDPAHVMTFRVALPGTDYKDDAAIRNFVDRMVLRLREIPGAESSGAATVLPIANSSPGTAQEFEGRPLVANALPPMVHYKFVSRGYFTTMRIPVVRGRDFEANDFKEEIHSVVANQALADLYWPGQNPIGKRIRRSSDGATRAPDWFTVVGVVGNERQDGLREPVRPLLYYTPRGMAGPMPQVYDYVVRGASLEGRADELRQAVWSIDRALPVATMRPMQEIVNRSIVEFTFTMLTLTIAAGVALLLGAIGLYGVLSYAVTLRTREIGVRLALGAPPSRLMRSVVSNGVLLAGIGLVLGLGGAVWLTRFLGNLLFETQPLDPATLGATTGALLIVAMLASYLPARRAAAVSPLESMKTE
ncbi:MAG TPA: ABC transporter permease [Vicinamibacterales bacterium]|nr:ABC transporter permease [Vicinamibacterales bacterium]